MLLTMIIMAMSVVATILGAISSAQQNRKLTRTNVLAKVGFQMRTGPGTKLPPT